MNNTDPTKGNSQYVKSLMEKQTAPQPLNKGGKWVLSIFIGLMIFFVGWCSSDKDASKVEASTKQETAKEPDKELTKEEYQANLNKMLTEIKTYDWSKNRSSIPEIQAQVAMFGVYATTIKAALSNQDKDIVKLGKQLKAEAVRMQTREFPRIRKAYKNVIYQKLWEEDITTEIAGTANSRIEFTGAVFAANKNKQEFQNGLGGILEQLRFKQTRYRWHKEADEYTYYTIDSPKDNDLINLESM